MREYRFRGKDKNTGKWVYGFYLEQDTYSMGSKNTKKDLLIKDAGVIVQNSKYDSGTVIDKETLGQYTGLHDKNGKEIYEGDIVKFRFKEDREEFSDLIGYIEYQSTFAAFRIMSNQGSFKIDITEIKFIEKIGNIYDNPELLEEGE